jgi:competence ComEA-like helix-hairpin-helix protein
MRGPSGAGTRWFFLSRRELVALAVGLGIVVAVANLGRGIEWLCGRGQVTIVQPGDALPPPGKINVNAAADYELAMLPHIGPRTAQAIVLYRAQHGPFASLDELTDVAGIGPATLEAVRPYAVCGPARGSGDDAQD